MFDSTEQTIPTSEPLKSPFPIGPGSPYQLVAALSSPVSIPPQDVQSQNNYNEYLNQVHSDASSTSSYSHHSGFMPTDEEELAMLLNDGMPDGLDIITSAHEPLALPISSCGQHTSACSTVGMNFVPHSLSYASSSFASQVDPSFSTPTLTSVHMSQPSLMDLAEASQMVGESLMSMPMGQLETTPTISQTPSSTSNFTSMSSVDMTIPLNNVTNSVAGAQMCSRSSQTANSRTARSLSPAPSIALSPASHQHGRSPSPSPSLDHYSISSVGSTSTTMGGYHYTPSPDPSTSRTSFSSHSSKLSGKVSPIPASKDLLVDMPYYQFKKILDDPSIEHGEKEAVKNIRKRGKNKVAAKNCRQKKIEVVLGLQQEVDQMKERKRLLHLKCQGLEREINILKQKCTGFRSLAYSH